MLLGIILTFIIFYLIDKWENAPFDEALDEIEEFLHDLHSND